MKRTLDIILATLALAALLVPLAAVALLIRLRLGSPVFFVQERPGLHGKPFRMFKFRTMTSEVGLDGLLLPDSLRLTRLGKLLRASSIDELPELYNVFKGDMSLVGPRPLLMHYLPLYSKTQARRHEVRPGITGWAQVNGRNTLTWDEKFELDVWYVDNQSIALDMRILFITLAKVLKREGISAPGDATMPAFNGNTGSET